MTCLTCGAAIPNASITCPNCGEPLQPETAGETITAPAAAPVVPSGKKGRPRGVVCAGCGTPNDPSATECLTCGESLAEDAQNELRPKKRTGSRTSRPVVLYLMIALGALVLTVVVQLVSSPEEKMGPPGQAGGTAGDPHTGAATGMPKGHPKIEQPAVSPEMTHALEAARTAYDANPKSDTAVLRLANALYDVAQHGEAIRYYREYLNHNPDDFNARTDMAYSIYETGDVQKAMKELYAVLGKHPRHQAAVYNMAMMFVVQQQRDSVIAYLERVVAIDSASDQGGKAVQVLQALREKGGK